MKRITQVEELTPDVIRHEIDSLLRRARAHVANRKAQLVLEGDFDAPDTDLVAGPMAAKMQRVFDYVTDYVSDQDGDGTFPGNGHMKVAELCEEVLEFLWSSMFPGHYQIPDSFWDTPLGFAIYEVIGRISDAPDSKELTSIQAAKMLGISQPYLHRLTREGKIPLFRKVGNHSRYRVGDIKGFRGRISMTH